MHVKLEEEKAEAVTVEAVEEYRREHGARAALDLLRLLGADRYEGDFETVVKNLQEIVSRQAVSKEQQKETDKENFERCRSIAQEIEELAEGVLYRCPLCGEIYSIEDAEETEDGHTCPVCCEEIEESEAEQISVYDYFSDVLDIAYLVGSDGSFRSVRLMVACGGPNIYVDTGSATVDLYWWGDRASCGFSRDAAEIIDEAFTELYACSR